MFGRVCAPSCTCVCVCACASMLLSRKLNTARSAPPKWSVERPLRYTARDSRYLIPAFSTELYVKKKPLLIPHTNTDLYEDTRAYKDTHVLVEWRDEESEEEEEVWLILSSCVWKEWWRWANAVKSFWLRRIKTHKYTNTHRHRYDLSI